MLCTKVSTAHAVTFQSHLIVTLTIDQKSIMKNYFILIALLFYGTVTAQISWTGVKEISTNTYGNLHPRVTLDRSGNPLVIWGKISDQSVYFSRWNGTEFTSPVKLNPSWLTIATADWMGPDIASYGDTVYVVVKRTPESSETNRLFMITSYNGGLSFNPPVELGFIADSISRFPTVTTDATGNPIVAFMKFNNSFLDSRWVVTKSGDYGNTFSMDTKASGWGGSDAVCDCCPGAILTAGNTCAMLYRNNNSNIRDSWTGVSTDNATSFTSGFALENNNWMIQACPSSGPDGVIIGDTLYSTFMNGGSGNSRTYFSKSSISTGAMSSVSNLTGTIPGLGPQNFPRIASDGTAMALVWKQTVSGTTQLPVLFTNDLANGFPASYDTVDLADITNADVALSNGNIFVVWEDDNTGTVKYRFGTYPKSTTGIKEVVTTGFSVFPNPASEELNISSADNKLFSLNIFNALGDKVYSADAMGNYQLSVSSMCNGLYFIQLNSNNSFYTQKFIKQ